MTAADADLTIGPTGEAVGQRIIVTGRVLDSRRAADPTSLVEIWQANASGRYRHRSDRWPGPLDPNFTGGGRCVTDADGTLPFLTIRPGAYPWRNHPNAWRPAHIHFSVFGRAFTQRLVTQMYFPDDPLFFQDPIFNAVPDPAARQRWSPATTTMSPSPSGRSGSASTSSSAAPPPHRSKGPRRWLNTVASHRRRRSGRSSTSPWPTRRPVAGRPTSPGRSRSPARWSTATATPYPTPSSRRGRSTAGSPAAPPPTTATGRSARSSRRRSPPVTAPPSAAPGRVGVRPRPARPRRHPPVLRRRGRSQHGDPTLAVVDADRRHGSSPTVTRRRVPFRHPPAG